MIRCLDEIAEQVRRSLNLSLTSVQIENVLRGIPDSMLSMMDVASVLGISKAGSYTLARSIDFPAFRVGRRIVVSQEKFLDWLEKQAGQNSLT